MARLEGLKLEGDDRMLARKAAMLDRIVAFLWPERQATPPIDHGWWEPGDGPYEWSSDTLQVISDMLDGTDLIDAG